METVGKPLVEMEGKQVRPSPIGELVLEHAQRILKVHDAAMIAISQSELKGRVRLGAPEDYCSLFVPQILAGFSRDYLDIRVDVICRPSAQLYGDLLRGELGLAICTALDINGEKIFQEPVVWVAKDKTAILEKDSLPLAVYSHVCLYGNGTRIGLFSMFYGLFGTYWDTTGADRACFYKRTVKTGLSGRNICKCLPDNPSI